MKFGRACQGPAQIDLNRENSRFPDLAGGRGNRENGDKFILRMGDRILMKLYI